MKKLIPLIAIAIAMALPLTISAQTPDYNGYDNSTKTVIMEWVENAINADDITFNPAGAEDAFLALIDTLYAKRDASDWSGCVTVAGYLESAAANITEPADEELVASLCECTGDVYTDTEHLMAITPTDQGEIQDALVTNGGGNAETEEVHCAGCEGIDIGKIHIHAVDCTTIRGVAK